MSNSKLLAGGATAFALALFAAPALAQSSGYGTYEDDYGSYSAGESGPQYSTPAEHARTEDLNQSQQDGSYAQPSVLNGEQPGGLGRAAAQSEDRAQAYHARVEDYRDRMQRYHAQQARYRDQRALYERNMSRYDRGEWRFEDYPTEVAYSYRDDDLRDVAMMHDALPRLDRAPVRGPDGWAGKVRGVRQGYGGSPREVEIALNEQFAVWVRADHLRFDPSERVVYTDLSTHTLWSMPGVYIRTVDYR